MYDRIVDKDRLLLIQFLLLVDSFFPQVGNQHCGFNQAAEGCASPS
jgi:hypothetical protein